MTDYYCKLVVGARLDPYEVYAPTTSIQRICPQRHTVTSESAMFCDACGSKIVSEPKRELIGTFVAYARSINRNHEELYEDWFSAAEGLGFHQVNRLCSNEDSVPESEYALGVQLTRFNISEPRSTTPHPILIERITLHGEEIRKILCALGFGDRLVEVYPCGCVSV